MSLEIITILETITDWKSSSDLFLSLKQYNKENLKKAIKQLVSLSIIDVKPLPKDDEIPSLSKCWSNIDLAMQRQLSFGGYFPELIRGKPPGLIKQVKSSITIRLPILGVINKDYKTFYQVLEARTTIRQYGKSHLTVDDLSHFLYRSARIKKMRKDPTTGNKVTCRPYPSGGARYPLEIYPVCNEVIGLKRGIYHYDPLKHNLRLVSDDCKTQKEFNRNTRRTQGSSNHKHEADVIFVITAVFARTMWKYKRIGLSLIFEDLGCLFQTMYLVATEMNLAPCALGLPNERLVSRWLNLNWFLESHVGTFTLGKTTHGCRIVSRESSRERVMRHSA